jgi:hypothetical protein
MTWVVYFHKDFALEFRGFPKDAKSALGEVIDRLREKGPALGRPQVDTLKGSRYPNMKEMRANTAGDWYRLAFAFDPEQQAVVLCGGAKGGVDGDRFYDELIRKADERYAIRLKELGR